MGILDTLRPHRNLVSNTNLERRNIDLLSIDRDVTVANELSRLTTRHRKTKPIDHVIQPTLEKREKILAGHTLLAGRFLEVVAELGLEQIVYPLDTLFLAQLLTIAHWLAPGIWAVLARWVHATLLDRARRLEAFLAFEIQLLPFAPA